ncbi:glutamyl-tRNA reductase [Georgenia sp. M64]|uniref:glutamyl-tRNA reductase n=1 Tax=Georgenia sp. M64 TaxID=3120520 RepID=UPI0030DEECF3
MLSANHHDLNLTDVERLSTGAHEVGPQVVASSPAVTGAVVLATCNRLEVYVEAESPEEAARAAQEAVARTSGTDLAEVARLMRAETDDAAVRHLFEVAAGLDSMVVGEREITGQVRRALRAAREAGTTSPLLEKTLQRATRTSRQVAVATDLARAGLSVVSVALDLAAARAAALEHEQAAPVDPHDPAVPRASLAGRRTLLVGTGSYAGASLAALRERGVTDVAVWSASGRARDFAAGHGVVVAEEDLAAALTGVDLVVTVRGTGTPVLRVDLVAAVVAARRPEDGPLVVVDLALHRDVEEEVADLDGVLLVDLPTVREHAPAATAAEIDRARQIVDDAVRELLEDHAGRRMDQAVVALRESVADAVAAEIERLPADGAIPADKAAQALRRLAARLLHEPTVRARTAGRQGRGEEYLLALEQVLGVSLPGVAGAVHPVADAPGHPHEPATHLPLPAQPADV